MSRDSDRGALAASCAQAGHPLAFLDLPDGGRLGVLPHGGRVIGLWPQGRGNLFWTHPALSDPALVRDFLHQDRWPNSGGDRCWLAPEVDLFFPPGQVGKVEAYSVPRALDPGGYAIIRKADAIILEQSLELAVHGVAVSATIARRCMPLADPFPGRGLAFAGYTLTTSLALAGPARVPLGSWQLLQLPAPGTMLLAVRDGARAWPVFGDFQDGESAFWRQRLTWEMNRGPTRKFGVLASHCGNRIGHLHRDAAGRFELVVREFTIDPEGDYRDALWQDPARRGFACQACLVDEPGLGRFNELEHHTPATVAGGRASIDHSRVLGWSGDADTILTLVEGLFPAIPPG